MSIESRRPDAPSGPGGPRYDRELQRAIDALRRPDPARTGAGPAIGVMPFAASPRIERRPDGSFTAATKWLLERHALAALIDLGMSDGAIARYLGIRERDVELLCRTYRL